LEVGVDDAVVLGAGAQRGAGVAWPERCFDVALTLLALPFIALIGAVIALAIYIDSPGPVIFRSRRIGRGGATFEMIKFRKMRREAPSHPVTLENDDRFTPIGRFLAATRLDELPQVVNVLRGEMRLVGPRPELEYFVLQYAEEYSEILTVTPGITGNAQLRFVDERLLLGGPSPSVTYAEQVLPAKIQIDLDYVRGHTLRSDLAIVGRTVLLPFALLSGRLRARVLRVRPWFPSLAGAALLAVAFIFLSSHLP
jgi:lipopolysaccharide/colanic/teichoic acid biosynthesis glycosyltransferase